MEHGASELVKEESHMVMTVKAEVDKAAQSTAYHGVQTNGNFTEEEPGLAELVKSEPALLVKDAVAEDGWQDIAELQCIQGPSTSAIVGSSNVLDSVADMDNVLHVKEELGAIDIGPTVLQHTDTWFTTNQKDVSVVKEERAINQNKTDPILCGGVKEGIIEDEQRADTDDRRSNKAEQSEQRALSQLYSCDECGKTYASKKSLIAHYRSLHSTQSHKCTKCKKKFPSKTYLYRHTKRVHSEQQYECAVCKKICRSKMALNQHVYCVHRSRPAADTDDQRSNKASQSKQRAPSQLYGCDKCGKTYASKHSLMAHNTSLHSTQSHKCTKCKKKFPSKAYLYRHTSSAHSEQQYECAVCKKICRSKMALNQHVNRVHRPRPAGSGPRIYICDYCQTTFKIRANLTKHITNVHARGSYNCSQCNKSFKCERYLMRHVARGHTAADTDDQRSNKASQSKQRAPSQLYGCDKCGKTYASKHSLMAHNTSLHSTQSHKCTKCKKKFPSKAYLYRHTSSVHSEQQYECAVCKKIYGSKPALSNHVNRIHRPRPAGSGPRIYICDYCQTTFKIRANLTSHITHVHSRGSYNCSQCNKSFKCERYLMRHVSRVHTAGSHQLHTCTNCGKNFKYILTCQRHEKRGKCTRPTAGNTSAVASTSIQQHNVVIVKEEPADGELELGPTVFQHMDCNYRPYKQEPQID